MQTLWTQLSPEGRFYAHLHHHRRGDTYPLELYVQPHEVRIQLGDQKVTLVRDGGELRIAPSACRSTALRCTCSAASGTTAWSR